MSRESVWNGNREDTTAVMTLDAEESGMQVAQTDSGEYQRVMECVPAEVPLVVPVTGESFCQCPTQTDLSSDPQLDPDSLECTCGEDESGCAWLWDEEYKSPAVLLSCCNRKVSFHPDYSCGTAAIRGSEELRHGQHFWEIKMTSPVYGTDMMVGIGTAEVNLDQFSHSFCSLLGSDAHSWGLSYTGLLHHKGLKVSFSPRFGQGSIIGLHLDTWHGTLTFYKNRRCIGVAATELRNKSFYPMVCSTAAKSSMKVISSVSAPTSLQYLCCTHLRRYLPDIPDLLTTLPLPPGLKLQIRQQLGWVLRLRKPETPAHTCTHTCTQHSDHEPQPLPTPFQDPASYLDPNSTYIPPTDTHLASNPDYSSLTPAGTHLTSQPDSASHTPIDTHLSSQPDSAAHTPADTHLSSRADSASHTPANTHLISQPDSASHTPTDTHLSSHPVSSCEDVSLYLDPDSLSEFGSCSDSASCVDATSCPCCDAPLSFAPCFHDDSLSSASCFSGPVSRPASPLPDSTHSRPGSASGNDSDGCSSEICQRKRCRWT